jgi:hypothetical protein
VNPVIGQWVARFRGARRLTRWHLVESVIAGREVTHCGRQLGDIEGSEVQAHHENPEIVAPDERCRRCG